MSHFKEYLSQRERTRPVVYTDIGHKGPAVLWVLDQGGLRTTEVVDGT